MDNCKCNCVDKDKVRDLLARLSFRLEHIHDFLDPYDERELDEVSKHVDQIWDKWLKGLKTEERYADGKHYGNCCNIPMTCLRCCTDEHYDVADKWLKGLE